jgi:hypothetical protein
MATTTTITTNYAGKFAGEYIYSALKAGDTLAKNVVTVKGNVKEAGVTVKRLSSDGIIKGSTCDFSPTSTITLDDRKLIVKKLQVNLEQCKEDFESDWDEASMGDSAFTDLPPAYESALMEYLQARVAQDNDALIWQGTAGADEYDGFLTQLAADAGFPAAGAPRNIVNGGITTANVIASMQAAYDDIPDNVYGSDDLVICVSYNVGKAWTNALAGFGTSGLGAAGIGDQGPVGAKPFDLNGVPIFEIGGLPADTIIIYKRSELWFGTGVLSDWNQIRFLDMADLDGSQNVRMIMRFYGGVQYAFEGNIVVSTTAGI